jgi:beta-phosphoglucomutase-like phosphatase (HAD superfamily)
MTFELIIFDCDGVLVDSEPRGNRLFVQMVAARGLVLDETQTLHDFNGLSIPERLRRLQAQHGWTSPDDFNTEFIRRVTSSELPDPPPIPGVAEVIDGLGLPAVVASNGIRVEIEHRVALAGLQTRFLRYFSGAEDVPHPKPAPDLYLYAAAQMGVAPERCFVVEDSLPGVTAARAAGMRVFGYARLTPPEAHAALGATPFGDMSELLPLLQAARAAG